MKTNQLKQSIMAVTLLVAFSSQGSTIFWGSQFNDSLLTSDGQALDGTFSFELGAFSSGFDPNHPQHESMAGQLESVRPGL